MTRVLLALALIGVTGTAWGHDWYSLQCCSEMDRRPVVKGEVTLVPGGWSIPARHTILKFADPRIKPSLDVEMHICQTASRVICLYVPDPGI